MRLTRLVGLLGLFASSSAAAAMNDTRLPFSPYEPLRTEPARIEPAGSVTYLQGIPEASASGTYQRVDLHAGRLHRVGWSWRVDELPMPAEASQPDGSQDDIGATVFFVFGEPSTFDRDVPTLAYTWSGASLVKGAPQRSPRHENLFYIALRGRADFGRTFTESRDVTADYIRLFGTMPPPLRYVAAFVDHPIEQGPGQDAASEGMAAPFGPIRFDA